MKHGLHPQPTPEQLPELLGLEKHHGYREYETLLTTRQLKPGDEIVVPEQIGGRSRLSTYTISPEGRFVGAFSISPNPKNKLQGLDWYVRRAESTR